MILPGIRKCLKSVLAKNANIDEMIRIKSFHLLEKLKLMRGPMSRAQAGNTQLSSSSSVLSSTCFMKVSKVLLLYHVMILG